MTFYSHLLFPEGESKNEAGDVRKPVVDPLSFGLASSMGLPISSKDMLIAALHSR